MKGKGCVHFGPARNPQPALGRRRILAPNHRRCRAESGGVSKELQRCYQDVIGAGIGQSKGQLAQSTAPKAHSHRRTQRGRLDDECRREAGLEVQVRGDVPVPTIQISGIDQHSKVRPAALLVHGVDSGIRSRVKWSASYGGEIATGGEAADAQPLRVKVPLGRPASPGAPRDDSCHPRPLSPHQHRLLRRQVLREHSLVPQRIRTPDDIVLEQLVVHQRLATSPM